MSEKIWSDDAWEDYLYWQTQDKKTLKRINQLIKDIERNGAGKQAKINRNRSVLSASHTYTHHSRSPRTYHLSSQS